MDIDSKYEPQAQFSIYKIDISTTKDLLKYKAKNDNDIQNRICSRLIGTIITSIKKHSFIKIVELNAYDFRGVVFKTHHYPEWKDIINEIIGDSTVKDIVKDEFLSNTNVSYVVFYALGDCLYCMTGGYGSHYIKKYIEKNYGLHLIPKLVSKDNPVVKKVLENNLIGNRSSIQRANRNNTSIQVEQDLSSIYRELALQIDLQIAKELGISFNEEENKKKKLNIINTDALVIRRSFTLKELKKIVLNINKLENKKDKFALNYFVSAKKKNLKDSDLIDELINKFSCLEYKEFSLVGDSYENYYFNSDYYEICDSVGEVFLHTNYPIALKDIFDNFSANDMKITKSLIRQVLKKWTIQTINKEGALSLFPIPIYDVLQGYLEYGVNNTICYLINGSWYILDTTYNDILDKEFSELYEAKLLTSSEIKNNYNLIRSSNNEDTYNKKFKHESNIIYTHTTLKDNVEIADLIFFDDNTIYLMHNKDKFEGAGARDLSNQILAASEYLQQNLSRNRRTFLLDYYKKICTKNKVDKLQSISSEGFIQLFDKRICFIAGYLKNYKKKSDSNYAKYLTVDLNKRLNDRGQLFIPLGIL